MNERELPEGVPRKQIVVLDSVREHVKRRAKSEGKTVSQWLAEDAFPEDWETVYHGYSEDEIVRMKVTPDVDGMVDRMTGGRVDKGEIIAYYALLDALRNGNVVAANEMIEDLPEMLWEQMEGRT